MRPAASSRGRLTALTVATGLLLSGAAAAGSAPSCTDHDWSAYGNGPSHTFAVAQGCSRLTTSTVPTLAPAWFRPISDSVTASPAVVGDTAYVGAWDGSFYALNTADGSVRWTFQTRAHAPTAFGRIVSSATVTGYRDPVTGKNRVVVLFGGGSSVWALDAASGTELASIDLDPRTLALRAKQEASANPPVVEVEASPAVVDLAGERRIFVGLDVHNDAGVGRTGLVSLTLQPARTGWHFVPLWKLDPETSQTYRGVAGLTQGSGRGFGCGGVWSSPAVDPTSRMVVFGTASCSHPQQAYAAGENYAEGIVAANAVTGQMVWRYRPADDLPKQERLSDAGRDADFGASPNLFRLAGRTVVGAGRKSADYYVRDLRTGTAVSTTDAGQEGYAQDGFGIGGFLGTPALNQHSDGSVEVVGATAIPVPDRDPAHAGTSADQTTWAVRGLNPRTGRVDWTYRLAGPSYGSTSVVNGVAFVPDTTNSSLLALDATTGLPLWEAPVVGPPASTAAVAGDLVVLGTGTRETDLEYKALSTHLQDALASVTGASPLSPVSGVQAFRLVS